MEKQKFSLPFFGEIEYDSANLGNGYEKYLPACKFGELVIDVFVEIETLEDASIEKVHQALADIQKLNKIATDAYVFDYHNGGEDYDSGTDTSRYMLEWYDGGLLNEIFSKEEFEAFIAHTDKTLPVKERLLSLLRLVSISIHMPPNKDHGYDFIVMDYAFGYDLDKGFQDDVLAVYLNEQYEVTRIVEEG